MTALASFIAGYVLGVASCVGCAAAFYFVYNRESKRGRHS